MCKNLKIKPKSKKYIKLKTILKNKNNNQKIKRKKKL